MLPGKPGALCPYRAPATRRRHLANPSPTPDVTLEGKNAPAHNPVWQLLATRQAAIQPKLTVSQPGDLYEQEADRIADHVMGMPIVPGSRDELSLSVDTTAEAHKSDGEEEENKKLQHREQSAAMTLLGLFHP